MILWTVWAEVIDKNGNTVAKKSVTVAVKLY